MKSGDEDGIISTYTGSDGRLGDALTCRAVSVNNPYVDKEAEKFNPVVKMDGKEIFRFAVKIMQKTINKLLHDSGCSIDEIDCIIPHQANFRIIEAAAKRLNISTDKFYIDLDKYGNTSAASIGIAFDEAYRKGIFKHGDTVILVGFGGGLTYGGSLIKI